MTIKKNLFFSFVLCGFAVNELQATRKRRAGQAADQNAVERNALVDFCLKSGASVRVDRYDIALVAAGPVNIETVHVDNQNSPDECAVKIVRCGLAILSHPDLRNSIQSAHGINTEPETFALYQALPSIKKIIIDIKAGMQSLNRQPSNPHERWNILSAFNSTSSSGSRPVQVIPPVPVPKKSRGTG